MRCSRLGQTHRHFYHPSESSADHQKLATTNCRSQNASSSAPAPPLTSATYFGDGESNALEDNVTNTPTPNPVVTIKTADSLAIDQPTVDLKAPTQRHRRRRRQSDSETDNERSPKCSNLLEQTDLSRRFHEFPWVSMRFYAHAPRRL